MSSYSGFPFDAQQGYLPSDFQLPNDMELAFDLISDRENQTANMVNIREIALYDLFELLTGQLFFSIDEPINPRPTYRMVVDFGTLPNATTKSVPHGIDVTADTIFTRIYATSTDLGPAGEKVPIPYVNVDTPTDGIEMWIDATNVNIKTTTANWVTFTETYVILEYLKG